MDDDCRGTVADCRQVLRELEAYLDGETPQDFEAFVSRHLSDCSPCLTRTEFQREVRIIIASKCRDGAPPGLLDRIRTAIEQA